ncbi:hypothetical protein FKW77_010409 [Venturia effusa]|uniref:Uncharacterized protein n=1 Tax=Venturia effusa TaxID=50376 RepID=A0A517L4L3_9PEZI|nr:hypothetical protein FKW77_010409 [Venturia effusa]
MPPPAPVTSLFCLLAFSSLGSAYRCTPGVSNEECLHPNRTWAIAPPDITPAVTYERATHFTCAPTVPAADCLASTSAFSACLARGITASNCSGTANLAAATTIPAPPTRAFPCTLTQPGTTDVAILDACPPRLPQPQHKPSPPPAFAFTAPVAADDVGVFLPTPTAPHVKELETPAGPWTTCVQNAIVSCTDALCTSDAVHAPRCTDHPNLPREGRDLCINGLPTRCEGPHCEVVEEAQRRGNIRRGKSGSKWEVKLSPLSATVPVDEDVCKGWEGPRAVVAPARPGAMLPTKTFVRQVVVGRPREHGLGKGVDGGD